MSSFYITDKNLFDLQYADKSWNKRKRTPGISNKLPAVFFKKLLRGVRNPILI